jgi:hypothetical protein
VEVPTRILRNCPSIRCDVNVPVSLTYSLTLQIQHLKIVKYGHSYIQEHFCDSECYEFESVLNCS